MENQSINSQDTDAPTSAATRRQIEWLEDLRSLGLEPGDVVESSLFTEPSTHIRRPS